MRQIQCLGGNCSCCAQIAAVDGGCKGLHTVPRINPQRICGVLDEPRYEFAAALSGLDALQRLMRDDFNLIILDVNMPGLNGFETARLIRRRDELRRIPIIFLTAADGSRTYTYLEDEWGNTVYRDAIIKRHKAAES